MRKEEIEHLRFSAQFTLALDKKEGVKAYEQYFDYAFPYLKSQAATEDADIKAFLKKEVARGPVAIRQIVPAKKRMRSRLRATYDKVAMTRSDKVLQKIGSDTSVGGYGNSTS